MIILRLSIDGSVTDINLVQIDEILIDSRCDSIVQDQCLDLLLILIHVIENYWKNIVRP